jgi:hypothetical protein
MAWWSGLDKEIYVSLADVKSRLGAEPRQGARREVAEAAGATEPWPRAPRQGPARPTAVLARQVATASYETLLFVRVARRHGFDPVVVEHRSDRFTVHNAYKRSLASLPIVVGKSRNGQPIVRRQKVVDLAAAEGRRLDEVVTHSGERLIDYHHRKLAQVLGDGAPSVMDLSDVVTSLENGAASYYLEFFKMLSGRLVLLEDFVADAQTADFFERTVLPAYRKAVVDTGRRPQIARLVPGRRTSLPIWDSYPAAACDDPTWIRRAEPRELVPGE